MEYRFPDKYLDMIKCFAESRFFSKIIQNPNYKHQFKYRVLNIFDQRTLNFKEINNEIF